jgi:hypothetical protein
MKYMLEFVLWIAIHDQIAKAEIRGAEQVVLADRLITEVLKEEIVEEATLAEHERCAGIMDDATHMLSEAGMNQAVLILKPYADRIREGNNG